MPSETISYGNSVHIKLGLGSTSVHIKLGLGSTLVHIKLGLGSTSVHIKLGLGFTSVHIKLGLGFHIGPHRLGTVAQNPAPSACWLERGMLFRRLPMANAEGPPRGRHRKHLDEAAPSDTIQIGNMPLSGRHRHVPMFLKKRAQPRTPTGCMCAHVAHASNTSTVVA